MSIRNKLLEEILAKTGGGSLPSDNLTGGWAAYFNGDLTPISIPAATPTKLTMDATTGRIQDAYLPLGVTKIWDSTTSQFDFSELKLGDMVDVRVDGSLTNTGFDESFVLNFIGAKGSAGEYKLPFASGNRLFPGASIVSRYNGVFIGSQDMIDNPSELEIVTTDPATGFLVDIYVKIIRVG
jgi:hypothetical protein